MNTQSHKPVLLLFSMVLVMLVTRLAGAGVQAASVDAAPVEAAPVDAASEDAAPVPAVLLPADAQPHEATFSPPADVQADESGCFALMLEVIGGMGEPPLASETNCEGGLYQPGTVVVLTAQPAEGFHVYRWQGTDDDGSTEAVNQVTMNADRKVGVHYVHDGDPHEPVTRNTPGVVVTVPDWPAIDGTQTVIGSDDRVRVYNTTDIPWKRIVFLDIVYHSGLATCTGWFAGPDLIITAGHCVDSSNYGWATWIGVTAGKNGSQEPFGTVAASDWGTVAGWGYDRLSEYDYGYVKLPDGSLGNQVGWFRYGYFSDAYFAALTYQRNINVTGYPGDKTFGTMWTDNDPLGKVGFYFLNYAIDTYGGQSGAPVWYRGDDKQYYVVAIHGYNTLYSGCDPGKNCGPRISREMADNFLDWGAATAPVTDCPAAEPLSLISPSSDEVLYGDPIEFSWTDVQNNNGYIFQVDENLFPVFENSLTFYGLAPGTHYWNVTAYSNIPGCSIHGYQYDRHFEIFTPQTPFNVSASYKTYESEIFLSWPEATGASEYQIYRSDTSGSSGELITTTSELFYSDTNAEASINYFYSLRSCDGLRCSAFSPQVTGRRTANPLGFPRNFTASDESVDSKVYLAWEINPDGTYYEIYRSTSLEDIGTLIASPTVSTQSYIDFSPPLFTTNYYRIRTCNTFRCSDFSNYDIGIRLLKMPPTLSAGDGQFTDSIRIYLFNYVTDATFYELYRSETEQEMGDFLGAFTIHEYFDYNAPPDEIVYYHLKACNASGCSLPKTDTGWRAMTPPIPPGDLNAADGSSTGISITWGPVPFATSYEIYRSTSPAEYGSLIFSQTGTSFQDVPEESGKYLYYRVKSCNVSGCGDYSAPDAGWRLMAAPTGLAASRNFPDKVQITWDPVPGASLYEIFRHPYAVSGWDSLGSTPQTIFDDTTAALSTGYAYTVIACADECSNFSQTVSFGWLLLAPPNNVSATDGTLSDRVRISWNNVESADFYKIQRSTTPDGDYSNVGSTESTSFDDIQVQPDTTYYYKVVSCFEEYQYYYQGCGETEIYDTGWRSAGPPAPPIWVTATEGRVDRIQVCWHTVTGADGYFIYRSTSASSMGTRLLGNSITDTCYDDYDRYNNNNVQVYTDYYYRVRSVNSYGEGSYSDFDIGRAILGAPGAFSASWGSSYDGIILNWGSVLKATYYEIERNDGTTTELIGSTTQLSLFDTTVKPEKIYQYRIRACVSGNCSKYSNWKEGWRLIGSPEGVNASDGTGDKITVTWNDIPEAVFYVIYIGTHYDDSAIVIAGITEEEFFTISSILPEFTYYFRVRACTSEHCGPISSYNTGWRTLSIPLVNASDGEFFDKIRLTWEDEDPGISYYKVYRSTTPDQLGDHLVDVAITEYEDTTILPGQTYYYKVMACTATACSPASPAEPGWRGVGVPSGVSASDDHSSGITVTWEAVADIPTYQIYRMMQPNGYDRDIGPVSGTSFEDTSAVPGSDYTYQVRACYESNCGAWSEAIYGRRAQTPPAGMGVYDDSGGMIFYEGNWREIDSGMALNGTLHSTDEPGGYAVFFFEGRCVSLHFTADKQQTLLGIQIDGVNVSTLNQYIPGTGMSLQTAPICVEEGVHMLRLVNGWLGWTNIDAISVVEPVEYEYQYFAPLFP